MVELAILLNKIIDTFDVVTPLEFMDLLTFFFFSKKKKRFTTLLRERMKEKRIGGSCLFTTTEKKRSRKVRKKNQLIPHLFSVQFGWKIMEGNLH